MLKSQETAAGLSNLQFNPSSELSDWLASLKTAGPTPAEPAVNDPGPVQVVELTTRCSLGAEVQNARGTIFIRDFYDKLLGFIWNKKQVALIGNPGIGKSCFQEYILLRIAQYGLTNFEDLINSPSCVIRQIGKDEFQVFLIQESKVFEVVANSATFLKAFDPTTCLYLYEPGTDKSNEPDFVDMKSVATVSPNRDRIKEYTKKGALEFYMPTWDLDELKQIGAYLRESPTALEFPDALDLYSEAKIEERFISFGGILRYVLPSSEEFLQQSVTKQEQAAKSVDYSTLLAEGATIDGDGEKNVSHFLLQYDVNRTTFRTFTLKFSSVAQKRIIQAGVQVQEYGKMRRSLSECTRGLHLARRWLYLQLGVPLMWYHGVTWTKTGGPNIRLPENLNLSYLPKNACPKNPAAMVPNTLYVPQDPSYPFVEAYFKSDEKIHGIQCKSGTSTEAPKPNTALAFRDKIGLADTAKLYVWYVVFAETADDWWRAVRNGFTQNSISKLPPDQKKRMRQISKSTSFGVLTHDFDYPAIQ
jgi:hypothetical protein